jgi:hypothetical protein
MRTSFQETPLGASGSVSAGAGEAQLASPVAAKTVKPPPYVGPATGTVSCDAPNIKVTFSPPLTYADLGPSTVTIKGTLKDCTTQNSVDVIKLGKINGGFTTSGGCVGLATGTQNTVSLTIQWKGSHGGAKTTYDNSVGAISGVFPALDPVTFNAGFLLPNPAATTPSTITGSFAGNVTDSSDAFGTLGMTALLAPCAPRPGPHGTTKPAKGIKSMKIKSGEILIP